MAGGISTQEMIGRRTEFDWLCRSLAAAADDEPSTVLIAGEAGVGKSRLVAEFAQRVRADGATVLSGECVELTSTPLAYAPLIEILRGLPRALSEDEIDALLGDGRPDLALLAPELGHGSAPRRFELPNEHVQSVVFERTLGMLRRFANRAPTALVIEDLHWADRPTMDLLQFLVHNLDDAGVLLIGTYRCDELHRRHPLRPVLGELERRSDVDRILVEPLGRTDTEAMTRSIRGSALAPHELELVHRRADGNPFFVEELLAGELSDALPERLRDIVLGRVDALSDSTRRVLTSASVVGRNVNHELLASLAQDPVLDALHEAVDAQILVVDPESESYRFRHALTREAIYDELLPPERTALHREIAGALEDDLSLSIGTEPTRLSEIADHWFAAHEIEKAAAASERAGRALEGVGAFSEGLRHYERVLELDVAGLDRVEILARAAEASFVCGDAARAIELIEAALDAGSPLVLTSRLYERRGTYRWESPSADRAGDDFRRALETATIHSREEARALAALGHFLNLAGETDEARPLIERALDRCAATGDHAMRARALTTAATITEIDGDTNSARQLHQQAIAAAELSGDPHEVVRSYCNSTAGLMFRGEITEARHRYAAAENWLEERGYDHLVGVSVSEDADILIEAGELDEAEAVLKLATKAERMHQSTVGLRTTECLLRSMLYQRTPAIDALRELELLVRSSPLPQDQACLALANYAFAMWLDDEMEPSVESWVPQSPIDALHFDAEIALLASMRIVDAARRDQVIPAFDPAGFEQRVARINATRGLTRSAAAMALELSAEICSLKGEPNPSLHLEAAAGFSHCGMKLWHAIVLWRAAWAFLDLGDHSCASDVLQDAYQCAVSMKAHALVVRIEDLASRYSITLATARCTPKPLTHREREVLALLQSGRTNRQIADELYISPKTASVHVTNIMAKLGVSSRYEAAALADEVLAPAS